MWKFSNFNHLFEADGITYLYNTLSTALVELNNKNSQLINDCNINSIDELQEFVRLGFVVPADLNESDVYKYFYDGTRFNQGAKALHVTFIPTYSCNLGCPYCYQGGAKDSIVIDSAGTDRIVAFVRKQIFENKISKPTKLVVSLYGGEPMMAKGALKRFCEGVQKIVDEANIQVMYNMVSNLTLLDEDMISLIKRFKITVQVSIDGTRAIHNQRRIKLDGSGTYDIIICNLQKLIDQGLRNQITIRLNVDNSSIESCEEVFSEMIKYSDDVYFAFLSSYKGSNDIYQERCIPGDCHPELSVKFFNKIIEKYGRKIARPFGKKAPCAINSESKYLIDCKFDVYKCDLVVNMPECRVGTLSESGDLILESGFYSQMAYSPFKFEKCRQCKMLPLCAGGCPATMYINSGVRDGRVAEYHQCTFTEKSLTEYLVDYVRRAKK